MSCLTATCFCGKPACRTAQAPPVTAAWTQTPKPTFPTHPLFKGEPLDLTQFGFREVPLPRNTPPVNEDK